MLKTWKKKSKGKKYRGKKNQTGSYVEIEKCKWHGACFNYLTPPCWNWLLLLGGENRMREFCKWDPQNFGKKFNPRHKSAGRAGWEVKNVRIPLWGELARIPSSRLDVPVVTRIYLQGAIQLPVRERCGSRASGGKRRGPGGLGTRKAGQLWLPQQCSLHSERPWVRSSEVKTKPWKRNCTKEEESGHWAEESCTFQISHSRRKFVVRIGCPWELLFWEWQKMSH